MRRHIEHFFNNPFGVWVNYQMVRTLWVFEVTKGRINTNPLAIPILCLESHLYFFACSSCICLIKDIHYLAFECKAMNGILFLMDGNANYPHVRKCKIQISTYLGCFAAKTRQVLS